MVKTPTPTGEHNLIFIPDHELMIAVTRGSICISHIPPNSDPFNHCFIHCAGKDIDNSVSEDLEQHQTLTADYTNSVNLLNGNFPSLAKNTLLDARDAQHEKKDVTYEGLVIHKDKDYLYQLATDGFFYKHVLSKIIIGKNYAITYNNGSVTVKEIKTED